ncbi:hypothetical protein Slin15195_G083330 [Septoria linicola]|uniref:SnoaL-like domain-containing protein n=1 Tax=Septoria linicola TaxID=215465 RepID=A0A9Q9AUF6_9PEZI|nr:hypothetical protein Slin14017_G085840 [Septoria linicola]USW55014.1 hypothetical protein Slin15195_G083330 [Septoria linicola]
MPGQNLQCLKQDSRQGDVDTNVVQKLETYMQGFISAINARNFDLSSEAWSYTDSSFKGEAERPPGASHLAASGMSDLQSNVDMFRFMAEQYPDYHIRIFDLSTEVDHKAGKATMFWNGETSGLPGGMTFPSVGMCDFKLFRGEEWRCTSFRGARGPGDGVAEAAVGGL